MSRNKERFIANEENLQVTPETLAAFQALPRPLQVLVTAEDWCPDVIDNLPILGRLARESGKLDVRVFPRDQNLDIADQYLNQGKFRSVPTFVFFTDDFQEVGQFIERTASATRRRQEFRQAFFASHPEFGSADTPPDQLSEEARAAYQQVATPQREAWRPLDAEDTVRELKAIVEQIRS
jgi:thiol-disulfide isomerase/thioredoxin